MKKIPKPGPDRSRCPIATALDLVGDKWSLLIVRDIALFNKYRNKDFQDAGEGIPSNILASRLKLMVENGLLEKHLYQDNPPRYEYRLTKAGQGLLPVLQSMATWSKNHVKGVRLPDGYGDQD